MKKITTIVIYGFFALLLKAVAINGNSEFDECLRIYGNSTFCSEVPDGFIECIKVFGDINLCKSVKGGFIKCLEIFPGEINLCKNTSTRWVDCIRRFHDIKYCDKLFPR